MDDNSQSFVSLEENLIRAGLYSPVDLETNRTGYLSPRQLQLLKGPMIFWVSLAGLNLCLVITTWIIYFLYFAGRPAYLAIFWSLLLFIYAVYCFIHAKPYLEDIEYGKVQQITGELYKHSEPMAIRRSGSAYCGVEINNHSFIIPLAAYEDIVEHQTYHLFYAPSTQKIVNLVPC